MLLSLPGSTNYGPIKKGICHCKQPNHIQLVRNLAREARADAQARNERQRGRTVVSRIYTIETP